MKTKKKNRIVTVFCLTMLFSLCWGKVLVGNAYQYNIASVSKTVTAIAVMRLVDEGKIELDEKVTTYIPEFCMEDERYKAITVRMLLNHSSGIMGSMQYHGSALKSADTVFHDYLLEGLSKEELKADPGSYSVYCNDGYSLLEVLVERVSGLSFTEYVESKIFAPLAMENSITPQSEKQPDDMVTTYINGMKVEDEICNEIGSGGIISTAEDMAKFTTLFMRQGSNLLTEDSKRALLQSEIKNNTYQIKQGDGSYDYGLGWDTVSAYPFNQYGIKALSKGGDLISSHANITVLPEENMSCTVLSSGGSSELNAVMASELLMLALKEQGRIPSTEDNMKQNEEDNEEMVTIPEKLKAYAGVYIGNKMYQVTFPNSQTLCLSKCDEEIDREQLYTYQKDGTFQSKNGDFLGLLGTEVSESGKSGNTNLSFQVMEDGNILLSIATYVDYINLGGLAMTLPLAQKVNVEEVPNTVMKKWKERDGNNYFIVNDVYNSENLMMYPSIQVRLSSVAKNFVQSDTYLHATKIIDENKAQDILRIPGMIGRDLNNIKFIERDGAEYLKVTNTGGLYMPESSMEELTQKQVSWQTKTNEGKWYKIGEKLAGEQVRISTSEKAAVYVYDQHRICIYTTFMKNRDGHILLPEHGYILFIGEDNNQIKIE